MMWIALALSQSTVAPYTTDLRRLFTADDYPNSSAAAGESGVVLPEVLVNPAGHVETCTIATSSGFRALDTATCKVIRERANFARPVGSNGTPVYKLIRTPIAYSLNEPTPFIENPDIELSVNAMPTGVRPPTDISISFIRKADGTVQSCRAVSANANVELAGIACNAAGEPPNRIVRDAKGQAVDASDSAVVRFVLDKR